MSIVVSAATNNLDPKDLLVECLVGDFTAQADGLIVDHERHLQASHCLRLLPQPVDENGECRFTLNWEPNSCGLKQYKLRVYPYHRLLSHPFEMGFMLWV